MEFEAKYLWNNSNKKYIPQKWTVPSTLSDQLVRRWIASTFIIPDELSLENMISSQVKRSPFLRLHKKRAFRRESEIIWYFIGVYILKRTLHDCLEILFTCWTKFLNTKRENSYLCAAAMWYPLSILMYWFKENLNSQLSQICQFRKNFLWKKCNAVWREISVE